MVLMATVFMYVFIEIAVFETDIASVVKWIAIPMCMASIFKFIADICEDINDRETTILKQKEQWGVHLKMPYNASATEVEKPEELKIRFSAEW